MQPLSIFEPRGTARPRFSALCLFLVILVILSLLTFHPSAPSLRSPHSDPTLHLVFPIDERSHGTRSCKSLLAACVNGYHPTIVNWDVVGTIDELYSAKIPGVYDFIDRYLARADEREFVLMADAYDIWLQLSPRALIRRFKEMRAKIAIGVDMWCWPNDPGSPECLAAPQSTVPDGLFPDGKPRFANSGTVLGTVRDMRSFYKRLNDSMTARPRENDQTFFNEMLPEGEMKPDYWYRMFWTTAGPGDGVVLPVRHAIDGDERDPNTPIDLIPPMVYHSLTGEIPVALHFNSDGTKAHFMEGDAIWSKVWWTRFDDPRFRHIIAERLRKSEIFFAHDGSRRGFFDVCPSRLLDTGLQ